MTEGPTPLTKMPQFTKPENNPRLWPETRHDSRDIGIVPQHACKGPKERAFLTLQENAFPCSLEGPRRARKGVSTVRYQTPPAASEGPGKPPDSPKAWQRFAAAAAAVAWKGTPATPDPS